MAVHVGEQARLSFRYDVVQYTTALSRQTDVAGLDFEELQDMTVNLSPDADASELDGLVAGLLIGGPGVPAQRLLKTLVEYLQDGEAKSFDTLQQGYLVQLVSQLAEHAQELHALDDMEWVPLVPNEELGLPAQVAGLALWCAGFIHGVGVAIGTEIGGRDQSDLPEACVELFGDLAEISRVDESVASGDEAEADYVELLEYVRTAAFTCAIELSQLKNAEAEPAAGADLATPSARLQ